MSNFIIVHDLNGDILYIRKSTITTFGKSSLGTTFIAQNGALKGTQISESPAEVAKLMSLE